MKKRIVKKLIGGFAFEKLQKCKSIKVGELITTCKGYNEKIAKIEQESFRHRGKKVVYDLRIENKEGFVCSLIHCCDYPPRTKEQIINDTKYQVTIPRMVEMANKFNWPVYLAVLNGKDPLNEDGTLKE